MNKKRQAVRKLRTRQRIVVVALVVGALILGGVWIASRLNLGSGTLGAALTNVPSAVSYDGTDLLGVNITTTVGRVVRYAIGAGTNSPVTARSWSGQYSSASGTALVQ